MPNVPSTFNRNSRPAGGSHSQAEAIVLIKTALRRWGLLAGVLALILAGGAVAATLYVWEPVYEAKQFVQVMQNPAYTEIINDGRNQADPKKLLATLTSQLLLDQLLHDEQLIKLQPDMSLRQLRKIVKSEDEGGELYAIICRHRNPKYAALAAEKLGKAFVEYHQEDRKKSLQKLKATLDSEIADIKVTIANISKSLEELNAQRMLPTTSDDKNPVDPDGSYYTEMLMTLYHERILFEQLMQMLERSEKSLENVEQEVEESGMANILATVENSGALLSAGGKIQDLKLQRSELNRLGSSHPQVEAINRRIESAENDRKKIYDRELTLARSAWITSKKQEIQSEIETTKIKIEESKLKINKYDDEVERLAAELKNVNRLDFEFQKLLGEQNRAHAQLADWEDQERRIRSKDMSLYPVVLRGNENVVVPTEPYEPYPLKILAVVVAFGIAAPFAAALGWEYRLRRISNPQQIAEQLSVEVMGEIADLPLGTKRPTQLTSRRLTRQLRLYEESVDNLSAVLSHTVGVSSPILAVTSASSNEGKTTLASQLAISSARSHSGRTLLIDSDLRSPNLHRLLGGSLDVGLVDVLSNTLSLRDAVVSTEIENLDLLTAGRIRTNPRRYFSGGRWAALLEQAKEHYDNVIVDTPPVLAASESLAISKPCDFTLVCVLRDVSRADAVKRACDRLKATDVRVVGCAFGGVPQSEYKIRYGAYGYNVS